MTTQNFVLSNNSHQRENVKPLNSTCESPIYEGLFELPHGLRGFFDYEQALACAKAESKPLFIDFTGHGCVNCREMEARVWSDPRVLQRLNEDFIVLALYVDDKKKLAEQDWYVSAYDDKVKKSIGQQNLDFMIQKLNANAQPYYSLVGQNENLLSVPYGYNLNVESFVEFLDQGKQRFDLQHQRKQPSI